MEVINPTPNPNETPSGTPYQQAPPQSAPVYQPQQVPQAPLAPVVSVGDWFVTLLVVSIPIVNLIVLLIWAFGGSTNPNKVTFAKANLIWLAVAIALGIFFFSSLMALIMALR